MSLQERLMRLQASLAKTPSMAYWIEDPVSLRYLTGLSFSAGTIIVGADVKGLLVDGRYKELARTEQTLYPVFSSEPEEMKNVLQGELFGSIKSFGISDQTSYGRFKTLSDMLQLQDKQLVVIEEPIAVTHLRMQKDEEELKLLQKAADLNTQGFEYACTLLQDGITEIQLAKKLEIFWLEQGGECLSFPPIIAFGPHSSQPHAKSANKELVPGDTVLIDIGVRLGGYHSDMTRTLFWKTVPPQMEVIYNLTLKAQQAALDACKAGMTAGALDQAARQIIISGGYGDAFSHGLGHGVGLEIHESPRIRSQLPHRDHLLKEGMVITIEPGIYLPGIGGVRIEDTVVVKQNGCDILTTPSKALRVLG